jgi:hypothetical protein
VLVGDRSAAQSRRWMRDASIPQLSSLGPPSRSPVTAWLLGRVNGSPGCGTGGGRRRPRDRPVRGPQDPSKVAALQGVRDAMANAVLGDRGAATEQPAVIRWELIDYSWGGPAARRGGPVLSRSACGRANLMARAGTRATRRRGNDILEPSDSQPLELRWLTVDPYPPALAKPARSLARLVAVTEELFDVQRGRTRA